MSSILKTLALALATAVVASPASAALVEVTWTGTISSGNDRTGIFGGVRGEDFDLAGFGYVAVYRFDTGVGSLTGDATIQSLTGGTSFGNGTVPSPAISAEITINGMTQAVGSDFFASYERRREPPSGEFAGASHIVSLVQATSATQGAIDEIFHRATRNDDQLVPSPVLTQSFLRSFGAGDQVTNSNFQFLDGEFGVSANLEPTSVDVVPEPSATWLGIAGLGALRACTLRRGRAHRIAMLAS